MSRPLGFTDVDGLGFAAVRGRLSHYEGVLDLSARDLGPFIEYALLGAAKIVPKPGEAAWLALDGMTDLYGALRQRRVNWVCPVTRQVGVFRTASRLPDDDAPWMGFCLAAQKAAVANGFPKQTAAQFAAALGELHSNIYEHSGAPRTGIIAFKGSPGHFDFVIADWGIGVLESLRRCDAYAALGDHREALKLALTNGVSRFGEGSGRGYGFHDLFTGLANLNGALRFRSGNAALTVEGRNPGSIPRTLEEKIPIKGFFASVACTV
jgi:hypothetical protein